MAERQDVADFEKFIRKIGGEIADEIDHHVKARTYKLKASNDSLRKELESAKTEFAGKTAEFDGQVARARNAETRIEQLEVENKSLRSEIVALREVLDGTDKLKRDFQIQLKYAAQEVKELKAQVASGSREM